jgi:integrase
VRKRVECTSFVPARPLAFCNVVRERSVAGLGTMAKRTFTETWIRNLKPGSARQDFTEAGRPGFMLRVWPGGRRTFVVRYLHAGRSRIMTLGAWPTVSLAEAHDEHAAARKLLARGFDPIEERQRTVRNREAEQRREKHKAGTVGQLFDEWMKRYVERERKRPEQVRQAFEAHVLPDWRDRPAREVLKRDVVQLLDRIVDRPAPVMANRVFNMLKQCFEFGVARDLVEASPIAGLDKPGGTEHARERNLTADEVRAFWTALDGDDIEMSKPVRLGLKLILLTAQRPGEVAGAGRSEFDLAAARWTIPASRTKNARSHDVPLSTGALELINDLLELAKDRPHLLPSVHSKLKPDEPLSQRALSRALRNNVDEDKGGSENLFGFEPFTPHDLRRTAASMMTALGIQRLHVSKVLNHTDLGVTGAVYDQHDYWPEKKLALETWADEVSAIVAGKARKVLPLKKASR